MNINCMHLTKYTYPQFALALGHNQFLPNNTRSAKEASPHVTSSTATRYDKRICPDPPNLAPSNFRHHGVKGGLAGTWVSAVAWIRNSGPAKGAAGYDPGLNLSISKILSTMQTTDQLTQTVWLLSIDVEPSLPLVLWLRYRFQGCCESRLSMHRSAV